MKCPDCNTDLVAMKRDGIDMEACPSCKGMWLSHQELTELEDEAFDLGEAKKGSLMLAASDTARKCPQCGQAMRTFDYREYDLELDFCGDGHGFWLEAGEDGRVLGLMKKEEKDLERSVWAEKRWAAHLRWMRSGSFFDRIRDLWG